MVAKQFPLSRATAFRSAYFLADACSDLSSSSYAWQVACMTNIISQFERPRVRSVWQLNMSTWVRE